MLQEAFGWLGYHLYRFDFGDLEVVEADPEFDTRLTGKGVRQLEPAETTLRSLFETRRRSVYEYDFGDSWEHEIVVEKKVEGKPGPSVPRCLAGARHRPPEDVGGVGGYEDFLASIGNKSDPERAEKLSWAAKDTRGRLFDPDYFYLGETNRRLEHVLDDTPEAAEALFLKRGGLVGMMKPHWRHPAIEVGGQSYGWERLGRLLLMLLDDERVVSIKLGPNLPAAWRRSE